MSDDTFAYVHLDDPYYTSMSNNNNHTQAYNAQGVYQHPPPIDLRKRNKGVETKEDDSDEYTDYGLRTEIIQETVVQDEYVTTPTTTNEQARKKRRIAFLSGYSTFAIVLIVLAILFGPFLLLPLLPLLPLLLLMWTPNGW